MHVRLVDTVESVINANYITFQGQLTHVERLGLLIQIGDVAILFLFILWKGFR